MTETDIVTERVFEAPRAQVFAAFSDPAVLARWWGPQGFTNTFQDFEFQAGGAWRYVMHGPDGVDYQNESVFLDIVAPELIMFKHESGHAFQGIFVFTDEGEHATRVHWTMRFPNQPARDAVKDFVVLANEENMDRLAAQLKQ